MSDFDFSSFFGTFLFYVAWVFLVVLLWNFFWLWPFPLEVPVAEVTDSSKLTISNCYSAFRYLNSVLFTRFDAQFWITHCGFDAFAYITFVRSMFSLVFLYFLISFLFGIPYAVTFSGQGLWRSFDLHDEIYKVYLQMFFLLLFTLMFYATLYIIQTTLSLEYELFRKNSKNFVEMQENTIRLKNLPRRYEVFDIRHKIQEILPANGPDSLVNCTMIPNTFDLIELVVRKKELKHVKSLYSAQKMGCFMRTFSPYANLDEKIRELHDRIEQMSRQELRFSGNAFVCLDSQASVERVLSHFSYLRIGFWRGTCKSMKKFKHQSSAEEFLLSYSEENTILASRVPCADDISWRNLNKESRISWFKRLGLNFLAVIVMIFFTTPASLITIFGLTDISGKIFGKEQIEPGTFSNMVEKNLSPLLIILVNQLLLYVIDELAFRKQLILLSATQMSILNLCFFYMLMNSFIIPALSLTTIESIFSFVNFFQTNDVEKVETLLKTFYLHDTGSLFVILLVQAGTFSFTCYLLRLPELFLNYFDRKLVCEKRSFRLKAKKCLIDESENFQFGYFYANTVIFLIIVLVFSTTVPLISLSGVFFLLLRLVCDSFELITAHRKEIESAGRIINRVIIFCACGGVFFEILMLAYYAANKLKYNIIIMAALIVGSVLFTVKLKKMMKNTKRNELAQGIDVDDLGRWEKTYKHPLVF